MWSHTHTHIYIYIYTYIYTHTHTHTHTHFTHTHTRTHVYIYIYIYIYRIYIYIYACIHTHTELCIHRCAGVYIPAFAQPARHGRVPEFRIEGFLLVLGFPAGHSFSAVWLERCRVAAQRRATTQGAAPWPQSPIIIVPCSTPHSNPFFEGSLSRRPGNQGLSLSLSLLLSLLGRCACAVHEASVAVEMFPQPIIARLHASVRQTDHSPIYPPVLPAPWEAFQHVLN